MRGRITLATLCFGGLAALGAAALPQEAPAQEDPAPPQEDTAPPQENTAPPQEGAEGAPGVELEVGAPEATDDEGTVIHLPVPGGGPTDAAQQEMTELFARVERSLRKIDLLLSDAGSGDTRLLNDVGDSGISELLDRSRDAGQQAVRDIDRILELAAQMGQQQQQQSQQQQQQSQQGGDGQQSQSGDRPQNRRPGQTGRETTPEMPGGQQQGDQPQDAPEDPNADGDPNSPRDSDDPDRENQEGDLPPGAELAGPQPPANASERWGDLPVQAREIFLTEGDRSLPVEYRDWIDAYYRRLNERGPR